MIKDTGIQLLSDLGLFIKPLREEGLIISAIRVGNILYQNQYMILSAQKGEFKEFPTLGVGITDMASDDNLEDWKKTIREEFKKDNLKMEKITITNAGMEIKAHY